ncbi:MAG TPA: hypothetical protein VJ898_02210 [Natrialbaceae archaeon]|nr:hypothetical protein [Natrialbaceae archaeon]
MDPEARVSDLLYRGETVAESVEVDGNGVVVTSHRVLALTPEGDGPNFRHVDRPNVTGVRVETVGASRWLRRTFQPFVLGLVLLAGGWIVDLDGLTSGLDSTSTETAGRTGVGGVVSMAEGLGRALAFFDDALLVGGALCLLLVAAFLGVYAHSRQRRLIVAVAGEEDLSIPVECDRPEAVGRLRDCLRSSP